jgi:hypothetical protein
MPFRGVKGATDMFSLTPTAPHLDSTHGGNGVGQLGPVTGVLRPVLHVSVLAVTKWP